MLSMFCGVGEGVGGVAMNCPASVDSVRQVRFPRRSVCEFMIRGERHQGVVLNLSRSGVFVETPVLASVGSPVSLRILDYSRGFSAFLQTKVARTVDADSSEPLKPGLGLEIVRTSSDFENLLEDCVPDTSECQGLYRVRVMRRGIPRSRLITVPGRNEEEARQNVRQYLSREWEICEVLP